MVLRVITNSFTTLLRTAGQILVTMASLYIRQWCILICGLYLVHDHCVTFDVNDQGSCPICA